jgi:hypothetical protein
MRPSGSFAKPKRNRRRLAMRILDAHLALLDTHHPPRGIPQLENITLQTLNREVFIH